MSWWTKPTVFRSSYYSHRLSWLAILWLGTAPVSGAEYFVAPNGNDTWTGTSAAPNPAKTDGPFASLERARDAVRKDRKAKPAESSTVTVRGGVYELQRPLALTAEDSGTPQAPVVWRNFQDERVTLSGGHAVSGLKIVTDDAVLQRLPQAARGKVREIDLKAAGLTDFGEVAADGQRVELFYQGQPMPISRWPNDEFIRIAEVTGGKPIVSHGIAGDAIGKFTIAEDRLSLWTHERDLRVCGYWFWDWSDERQKVKSIDPKTRTIELEAPAHGYGYRKNQRFYVFNALAELDVPGEWYLDRTSGKLYFWPPKETGDGAILSVLPTLVTLKDAASIVIRGFVLENTRANAINIEGGAGVKIAGCLIHNVGASAVAINGGKQHGVQGCDIEQTGEGGISLSGGDRLTLTPSGHYAENNHIHHFARLVRTYRPAIGLTGCGHKASHNLIHDAPHTAILCSGNDHVVEFNDIHHVCQETGDVGAFYMGRDWSMRGNHVRHNYFHELSGPGLHGSMAVYLDDAASGTTIYGNIFYRASRAAFIGGGRDNIVDNNIFVECKPSVHIDARGLNWMKDLVAPDGFMPKQLAQMPYKSPPWSTRYPELVRINEETPAAPRGNQVRHNISINSVWLQMEPAAKAGAFFEDNLIDQDPSFESLEKLDFRLRSHSAAFKLGFKTIPIEQIGLQKNEWRTTLKP